MTTDKDDYVQQTITGAYGFSKRWKTGRTNFAQIYNQLSDQIGHQKKLNVRNKIQTNHEYTMIELMRAKVEIEYQIEYLNKHLKNFSSEGKKCAQQLTHLFDEAHSLISNAFYQKYSEANKEDHLEEVDINREALLMGLIEEIISRLESLSQKKGHYLERDVQFVRGWLSC